MAKDPKASEPFVSQQDRPSVGADTPVSELKVRDLHTIMANAAHSVLKFQKDKDLEKIHKDFDKTHPDKPHKEIFETAAGAKHLPEKFHPEKFQPEKIHPEKIYPEKLVKEFKEHILDQLKNTPELQPDPTQVGGDPLAQIGQLQATVDQLASEVAELKKR